MWLNGKFCTESEVKSHINSLKAERDKYRNELVEVLREASTCVQRWEKGDDADCSKCPHESWESEECPSALTMYEAKLRLKELREIGGED